MPTQGVEGLLRQLAPDTIGDIQHKSGDLRTEVAVRLERAGAKGELYFQATCVLAQGASQRFLG